MKWILRQVQQSSSGEGIALLRDGVTFFHRSHLKLFVSLLLYKNQSQPNVLLLHWTLEIDALTPWAWPSISFSHFFWITVTVKNASVVYSSTERIMITDDFRSLLELRNKLDKFPVSSLWLGSYVRCVNVISQLEMWNTWTPNYLSGIFVIQAFMLR